MDNPRCPCVWIPLNNCVHGTFIGQCPDCLDNEVEEIRNGLLYGVRA